MKLELHVHTQYSHDSLLDKYLMLFMCKLRRINCIAITDHNNIDGGRCFKPFLEKHGVHVIVGEEVFTADGEIIGLYLKENIAAGLSAVETVKLIQKQGGLVYLPHPYDEKRYMTVLNENAREAIKEQIDLVEFHNGRNVSMAFTKKQTEIASSMDAINVVGSDAHTFFELGRNYLEIDSMPDSADGLKKILVNERAHCRDCIRFAHWVTRFARMVKMVEKGDFNGLRRVILRKIRA